MSTTSQITEKTTPLSLYMAVALLGAIGNTSMMCSPAIASQLSSEYLYPTSRIGLFFSVEYTGYMCAGFLGRWLMPRYDWRKIGFYSLVGLTIGSLITVFLLQSFAPLIMIRLVTATCSAMLGVVCLGAANAQSNSSRAVSAFILGQLLWGVVGLAILPSLFAKFGLETYFIGIGVIAFSLLPITKFVTHAKEVKAAQSTGHIPVSKSIAMLRFPALLTFYMALGGIWTFVGDIAKSVGLDALTAGNILSGATVAGIVGSLTAATFKESADPRRPLALGYICLLVACFGFMSSHFTWFLGAALIFKFAWTFAVPFILSFIARLDVDGRIAAEITLLVGVGLAAGPFVAGQIIEYSGGFSAMLMTEAALLLIGWGSLTILSRHIASATYFTEAPA